METQEKPYWRKCSSCKKPIALGARYYVCSVSTCNGLRTGYVFCSIPCFERHLPAARHKDAGAVEKTAPMTPSADTPNETSTGNSTVGTTTGSTSGPTPPPRAPVRVFASAPTATASVAPKANQLPKEVLVIASRLKDYIAARSEYNTSQSVMDVLSDHLRTVCDRAIDNARADGRKTVMDRDFSFLKT